MCREDTRSLRGVNWTLVEARPAGLPGLPRWRRCRRRAHHPRQCSPGRTRARRPAWAGDFGTTGAESGERWVAERVAMTATGRKARAVFDRYHVV